jgi:3D (Asp-Asp-Asp) domain-containing protein
MNKFIAKISKKIKQISNNRLLPMFMLAFWLNLCFPHLAVAQSMEMDKETVVQLPVEAGDSEVLSAYPADPALPQVKIKQPRDKTKVWLTAYNSLPAQTDDDPCTTASGLNVCERNTEDVIATNYKRLPFGTKVRFPELYGNKIFVVEDRMNQKYSSHADIWLKEREDAIHFGRKYVTMEIL